MAELEEDNDEVAGQREEQESEVRVMQTMNKQDSEENRPDLTQHTRFECNKLASRHAAVLVRSSQYK